MVRARMVNEVMQKIYSCELVCWIVGTVDDLLNLVLERVYSD